MTKIENDTVVVSSDKDLIIEENTTESKITLSEESK